MTEAEVAKALEVVPGKYETSWRTDDQRRRWLRIEPPRSSYRDSGDLTVTFDVLEALSKAFHTRQINIVYVRGFGGGDVTPPDPDEFAIEILVPV